MLSCRQATRLMSEAQDRKLGLAEKMSLELHLAMCKIGRASCRERV